MYTFLVAAALVIVLCFTSCEEADDDTVILTKIAITDAKTVYLRDSTFNKNGIRVDALYSDGATAIIRDYTVTGFDSTQMGKQTLTVHYQGKSAFFDITIVAQGFIEMAEVSGGQWFSMGSEIELEADQKDRDRENPPHQVIVTCFYMGTHEVTQKEYCDIMGTNPSTFTGDTLPVTNISWYDAVEFCNTLSETDGLDPAYIITINAPEWTVTLVDGADGYRLPTEAEWEYACRAGTVSLYSTGNAITTDQANFDFPFPKAVGSYASNPWGLYDMHGNVWEWCWDWYDAAYYTKSHPPGNPAGPLIGEHRVRRGGSWSNIGSEQLRSSFREKATPDDSLDNLGFRVLRSKYPEGIPSSRN